MIGIPSMLQALAPLWIVAGSTLLLLLIDAVLMRVGKADKERELGGFKGSILSSLTTFVLFFAAAIAALNFQFEPRVVATSSSMLVVDSQVSFAMVLLCIGALITLWFSLGALTEARLHYGEFYPLLLFSLAGALAVVSAANLIMLFVAMELMSLPFYVLVGFDRGGRRSNRAGLEVFSSGAFASALSLYGMALIYGATGHFDYPGIRAALDPNPNMLLAGEGLLLVGLLTRIAAFPFHQWSLGVAAGAPAAMGIFMPAAMFGASAFALKRLVESVVAMDRANTQLTFAMLAGASMLVGATLALRETNVKKLFANAGVAHAGFLLLALCVVEASGRHVALFEVSTFVVMQIGALGVVAAIATTSHRWENISDYEGLASTRPILAGALAILLLALAGVPGTSGFVSRLLLMSLALGDGQIVLTLVVGVASVLLFAAYLRIITAMYMGTSQAGEAIPLPIMAVTAIGLCVIVTVYLGIFPGEGPFAIDFLTIVRRAARVS